MKAGTIAQPVETVSAPNLRAKRRILPLEYTRRRSLQVLIAGIFVMSHEAMQERQNILML